ncbi:MAG: cupin domain-containing protein [Anaerolineales bacterium]|nr:cupin domain-containing protein [Anaerolineales bacterium]
MEPKSINIKEKFTQFSEHWSPKIIAQMNDYHFKIAKIKGDFIWHDHPETDETFIVIKGRLQIEFHDGVVNLEAGEMLVVPKGVAHKPIAAQECHILLVEPAGTVNTGDADSDRRSAGDDWI